MIAGRQGRRTSLRAYLLASIGLIVVLSVALTIVVAGVFTQREVGRATLRDVSHQADLLAGQERKSVCPLCHLGTLRPFLARQNELVLTPSLSAPSAYLSPARLAELASSGHADGAVHVDGIAYYFAARPVGGRAFMLLRPKEGRFAASQPYLEGIALAGLAGIALAVLASFLLARAIARPVRRVAEATRGVASFETAEPVPVEGPHELAVLAESFNAMASQLDRARAAERQFLLSVSHELKTPLTAIRGYNEGLAEGALPIDEATDTIGAEAHRLERLVQDLLDLARMNKSEFSVHSEPIDLACVSQEVVRRYEQQARAFGVGLEVVAPEPAHALGDSDRTLQVASNLVENALRLTPAGGTVRVVAEGSTLAVEDNGPGLKPDELPRAFERFFLHSRYGRERAVGTGLGLAIVKELTEGMSGSVEVQSRPGELTRFIVRLPSAPAGARVLAPA